MKGTHTSLIFIQVEADGRIVIVQESLTVATIIQ